MDPLRVLDNFPAGEVQGEDGEADIFEDESAGLEVGMKASYPRFERCCVSSDECHSRLEESRVSIAVT